MTAKEIIFIAIMIYYLKTYILFWKETYMIVFLFRHLDEINTYLILIRQ
jgi:hypothetical protein